MTTTTTGEPGPLAARADRPAATRLVWRRAATALWYQHRTALISLGAMAGALAVAMPIVALQARHFYAPYLRHGCTVDSSSAYCLSAPPDQYVAVLGILALGLLPLLIGAFLGAPLLASEWETGTWRFAWAQGLGRTRWIAAKLTLLTAAVTGTGLLLNLLSSWLLWQYNGIGDGDGSRWQSLSHYGVIGFTTMFVVAFTIGVFAGAVIPRVVAASAVTTAVMVGWLFGWDEIGVAILRVAPVTSRFGPGSFQSVGSVVNGTQGVTGGPLGGAWVLRGWIGGPAGQPVPRAVPRMYLSGHGPAQWLSAHHAFVWASYQPAGRFWMFSTLMTGAPLVLAAALLAITVWLVHRRHA